MDEERRVDALVSDAAQWRQETAERLHDGPVQVLTAAALRLGLLRSAAPADLVDELAEIERLVVESLSEVRREMEHLRASHGT